ncbi:hypothetical protein HK101_007663 [Irineochytrium annulatum]|nr:hypothetical protein HK101_007663 [Irineochytrium annulatum]
MREQDLLYEEDEDYLADRVPLPKRKRDEFDPEEPKPPKQTVNWRKKRKVNGSGSQKPSKSKSKSPSANSGKAKELYEAKWRVLQCSNDLDVDAVPVLPNVKLFAWDELKKEGRRLHPDAFAKWRLHFKDDQWAPALKFAERQCQEVNEELQKAKE